MAGRSAGHGRGADTAQLARGGSLNLFGMLVSQVAGVGIVLVMARTLGDATVGVYAQAFALRALLLLVCALGTRVSMTHFVARYRADGDAAAVRGVARLGLGATALTAIVSAVALAVVARSLAEDVFGDAALRVPIQLAALSLPFFVVMTVALAATQGFKTMRAFAGVGLILEPAARFVVTMLLLALGFGIVGAMWAVVVASVVAAVVAVIALRRYVARMGSAEPVYHAGDLTRFSMYSWVASIATQGLLWIDIVILGALVSSDDVGVYQVATRVVLLGTLVTPALTATLAPHVADAWRRDDQAALRAHYRTLTGWTYRISLPILVTIAVFCESILRVFGGSFEGGTTVILVLVAGAVVDTVSAPAAVTLNQAAHNRVNMVINVAALGLNVALNFLLIPPLGIEGAAIAWAAALVLPGAARMIAVRAKVTLTSPWTVDQARATLAVVIAGLVAFGYRIVVPLPWWMTMVTGAVLLLVVYIGVIVVLGPASDDTTALRSVIEAARTQRFNARRALDKVRLRRRLHRLDGADSPLRLLDLVSPFRYDIEVRRQFMELIAEHESLWRRDPDAFITLAKETPYHVWYRSVAVHSIGVDADDPVQLARGFARRVRTSLALFEEYRAKGGFDRRYPITVRRVDGEVIGNGKCLHRERFVPVDGCHRLALLMLEGREWLEPGEYRIAPTSAPVLDNTERLAADLGLDAATYYRFISLGFGGTAHSARDELLASLSSWDSQLAEDVDALMRVDEAAMAAVVDLEAVDGSPSPPLSTTGAASGARCAARP